MINQGVYIKHKAYNLGDEQTDYGLEGIKSIHTDHTIFEVINVKC
jgi:hypothetical protein